MISDLKTDKKVVGVKQSRKAVAGGNAAEAFIAGGLRGKYQDGFCRTLQAVQRAPACRPDDDGTGGRLRHSGGSCGGRAAQVKAIADGNTRPRR